MTVAFIGGLNYYSRNTTMPASGAHTFSMWIKPTLGASGSARTFYGRDGNTQQWCLGLNTSDKLVFLRGAAETVILTGATTVTGNVWHHVGFVRDASNNYTLFYGNESTPTASDATTNGSFDVVDNDVIRIGSDRWAGRGCPSDACYARVWTAALTGPQMAAERLLKSAGVATGLWGEWDFATNAEPAPDASGNGRTLTKTGSTVNAGGAEPAGLVEPGAGPVLSGAYLMPRPSVLLRM
jgi:hypothetical protein